MEPGESKCLRSRTWLILVQKEQRDELAGLLKKYGDVYEPWRKEKEKFKGNGSDLQ